MAQAHTSHKPAESDSLRSVFREGVKNVADAGTDMYNATVDQASLTTKQVDKYVRHNPWYAVGIAAGVGFLFGLMMRPTDLIFLFLVK